MTSRTCHVTRGCFQKAKHVEGIPKTECKTDSKKSDIWKYLTDMLQFLNIPVKFLN